MPRALRSTISTECSSLAAANKGFAGSIPTFFLCFVDPAAICRHDPAIFHGDRPAAFGRHSALRSSDGDRLAAFGRHAALRFFDGDRPAAFGRHAALRFFDGDRPAAFCRHAALAYYYFPGVNPAAFRRHGFPPTAFGRKSLTALFFFYCAHLK